MPMWIQGVTTEVGVSPVSLLLTQRFKMCERVTLRMEV